MAIQVDTCQRNGRAGEKESTADGAHEREF